MSATSLLPFLQSLAQPRPPLAAAINPPDPSAIPDAPNIPQSDQLPSVPDTGAQAQAPPQLQETKGHKLLRILQAGLVGGLNGLAADQQTYAATGRNAGFGGGFQGAIQLPFLQAMQRAQLGQQQAETELTRAQSQTVQTPLGPMPGWLAKVASPAIIRAQGAENVQASKNQGNLAVAQVNKRYMAVPNVGLYDTQTKSLVPDTQNGITITPEIAQDYGLPQQFVGKPMNVSQLSQLERSQNQQEQVVQGTNGPALVNKKTGNTRGLGLGNPGMGRPMQIADPNNPGQTIVTTGAGAQGQAGTGSASLAVAKKAAVSEVPTKIGDLKVAFNTAIQHADLLRNAVKALGNGDQQTLGGLKNRFKNEFGVAGPITAQAIADAYQREVTSVLSKGHMTDSEIASVGKTLNPQKQNYQQIDSVIGAYQALAQSKMNMLNQQTQRAIQQSQPKGTGKQSTNDPLGLR